MSHVDEGQLTAYLDCLERGGKAGGAVAPADLEAIEAHLAECTECRARLDEVRRLRERAGAILRGSGPSDASGPPFEEILARRQVRARRRTVFRMNRLTAIGWAATIVVAVGVGWMARSSLEWGEPRERQVPQAPPITARAPATSDTGTATESGPTQAAPARSGARERDEAAPPVTVADAAAGAGENLMADADVAEEGAGPPAGEPMAEPQPMAEAMGPPPPEAEAAAGVLRLERARDTAAEAQAAQDTDRARRVRDETLEAVKALPSAAVPDSIARARQGQVVDWTPASAEEVEQALGGTPLTVPELPVRSMAVGALGNRPAVRVLHELSSGVTLTLVEWRDLSPPQDAAARQPAVVSQPADDSVRGVAPGDAVLVRRGGYVLLVWAQVSRDSLLTLVERVR